MLGKTSPQMQGSRTAVANAKRNALRVEILAHKGVKIPKGPHAVFISPEVNLDRIEPGAILYNADIYGEQTLIRAGAEIGQSGPVTIYDSQIGRGAQLTQGVIGQNDKGKLQGATVLGDAVLQEGFKVRSGSLLEEQADIAHTVGLKNSILLFAAVIGSQVNYCDVLVGGGKNRADHAEIGSTTTHFNFTPWGDKWASWIGPWTEEAVWFNTRPPFVGGQTQMVGPVHIDAGVIVAAGARVTRSVSPQGSPNVLYADPPLVNSKDPSDPFSIPIDTERYGSLLPNFQLTAMMIGGYYGLKAWYEQVRLLHAQGDTLQASIYRSAITQIERNIAERIKRLEKIVGKLDRSIKKNEQEARETGKEKYTQYAVEQKGIAEKFSVWQALAKNLYAGSPRGESAAFPSLLARAYQHTPHSGNFIGFVKEVLEPNAELKTAGTFWLREIREHYAFPEIKLK